MSQQELLSRVVPVLTTAGIDYMVTGSIASSMLRWAKLSGGSEKQFTDALRVYEVQGVILDLDYLNHWASRLEVVDLWQQVRSEAELA